MSAVLKKSTPGKFAYTCHFQQIGINATKIEKTGIHFKVDVFAAVAVVDAKAPKAEVHVPVTPHAIFISAPYMYMLYSARLLDQSKARLNSVTVAKTENDLLAHLLFKKLFLKKRHQG